jgi:acyl-CoA thioesterase-1
MRLFLVILLCLTIPSLGLAQGAEEKPRRIVFLGDSLTAGYGLDPAAAYPSLLQKKIDQISPGWEVVNAGVSGDTTAGGVRRVDWALSRGADILVIALGGNDGLRGVPVRDLKKNLETIISRAREKAPGIEILLAGMQMPQSMGKEYASEYGRAFSEVAEKTGVILIPYLLEGVGGVAELNQPDGIHPTEEGQRRLAETVWEKLESVVKEKSNSRS